ncbi:SPOR domain-containing protein [Salipiger sp. IMCC34102]|uniref:SPOR domain-containing protein n=1 Tax=Salipiger sp. IMCC34102 TaxID=2510647 RepID=UPI00101B956C|nr:SPOR domain-containing protein [Salipiger sp. IMCC34102]RYH02285.1 SPOR domain-containing protein [Salipiger sp. IMCC34102]
MRYFDKTAGLALTFGLLGALPVAAQDIPAEFPPSSYEGQQYVDSEGCAFIRAGMDGRVNWVPRVDRARRQLCNFQPSLPRIAEAEPEPTAPVATPPVVTATATPAPTPAPPAAPVIREPRPAATVAAAAPPRASTPRVIAAAPATAPAPRRISRAEACSGRFGVQPGFVSESTGRPIDCGPAPVRTARAAPVVSAPQVTNQGTQPLRLTLEQACARIAGGANLVTTTGAPIACPSQAPVQIAQAPIMQAPLMVPRDIPASNANACGVSRLASVPGVRCGPQALSPSGLTTRSVAGPAVASISTRSVTPTARAQVPTSRAVPASNAVAAVARPQVLAGYDRVWEDGRINSQRGLPAATAHAVAPQPRISSRSVAPAATPVPRATASGHRYVQVGSFGVPENAARLIARLQAAGLPVASGRSGGLKVVAAGPFASAADLNRALGIVRSMGFADAYTRG